MIVLMVDGKQVALVYSSQTEEMAEEEEEEAGKMDRTMVVAAGEGSQEWGIAATMTR